MPKIDAVKKATITYQVEYTGSIGRIAAGIRREAQYVEGIVSIKQTQVNRI